MRLRMHWNAMVLGLLIASVLSSCAAYVTVSRQELLAKPAPAGQSDPFSRPPGQAIKSYATTDGVAHEFDGRAWVEGDSMMIVRGKTSRRVALHDLESVVAEKGDDARTLLLGLGIMALAYAVWFSIGFATL